MDDVVIDLKATQEGSTILGAAAAAATRRERAALSDTEDLSVGIEGKPDGGQAPSSL
jgi:hypothetical protein